MKTMANAVKTQLEVKSKCEQVQQSLKDLCDWEQEMKQKEALSRHQQEFEGEFPPPLRSRVDAMHKFMSDQINTEKLQLGSKSANGPVSIADLKEAERLGKIGGTFLKRAKDGMDPYGENNDQMAVEMYTKAIELNSQDPGLFVNRAHCFFKLERYEECIADCNAAMELNEKCSSALYRRMQAYEYLGNNKSAYADCQQLLTISKDRHEIDRTKHDMERIEKRLKTEADVIKAQGNKHWANKEYEEGRQCFSEAISLYSGDPIYFYNRCLCHFHLKDYDSCLEDCNKAIALDKSYFRPYYQRMRVRELKSDFIGAISDCQKYLELVKNEKQRLTAEKDLERLQLALKQMQQPKSYNWNELRKNASLINFTQKPPHLRSKNSLKRISISEHTSSSDPKATASNYVIASNYEAIPDSVIDKIFNNNTGERLVEPKPVPSALENLFPSSSSGSNKLKQFFSPPTTPSSPPKDSFRQMSAGRKETGFGATEAQQDTAVKAPEREQMTNTNSAAIQVSQAKKVKDIINKGNCSGEAAGNSVATVEEESSAKTPESSSENPYPPIPSSSVKFYHTWINLKTREEKYQYLQRTLDAPLHKLLGVTMSADMLGDIFHILAHYCEHEKASPFPILREVTKNPNVGLLVLMLSEPERYAMFKLFDFMAESGDDEAEVREIRASLIN